MARDRRLAGDFLAMAADNTLALAKLEKEQKDLEKQRTAIQNQLYAVSGALNFCTYLIGVITKGPEKESLNGPDPEFGNPDDPRLVAVE